MDYLGGIYWGSNCKLAESACHRLLIQQGRAGQLLLKIMMQNTNKKRVQNKIRIEQGIRLTLAQVSSHELLSGTQDSNHELPSGTQDSIHELPSRTQDRNHKLPSGTQDSIHELHNETRNTKL